jgi:hypothetical protein
MKEHAEDGTVHDEGEDVIAEVRAAREAISARFGHDPHRLVAYCVERQKGHPERLLRVPEPEHDGKSAA